MHYLAAAQLLWNCLSPAEQQANKLFFFHEKQQHKVSTTLRKPWFPKPAYAT